MGRVCGARLWRIGVAPGYCLLSEKPDRVPVIRTGVAKLFFMVYKCHRLQGLVTVPLAHINRSFEIYQGGEHWSGTNDGRFGNSKSIQAPDG
jgi:hypothetical protein